MAYINTHTRTSAPTSNDSFQPMGRAPTLYGVFLGFIKSVDDVQKNGRLRVWIPEFGSTPDNEAGWTMVQYSSPFAGATNVNSNDQNNIQSFEGTQTSYGMWMIPPDLENQVLVMFINGDPSRGVYIGCLYNQFMNNMVPAMAASTDNYQYPGTLVPVAEYNKYDGKIVDPDKTRAPYEATKFKGVGNQGLIRDFQRGVTETSARRESPSQVFGILTPGPLVTKNAKSKDYKRKGGSSFIMDDGVGSEYVQLSTKSGAQIKINETTGAVYIINRDGTAWVQMDYKGNVDIFGAQNISMRAQYDFNIRADRNVNIEAGQNVYIKAAKDTLIDKTEFTYDVNNIPKKVKDLPLFKYVGEGKGHGGDVVIQAKASWNSTAATNANLTAGGSINLNAGGNVNSLAGGEQNIMGSSGVRLSSGGSVDIKGTAVRVSSSGMLSLTGSGGIAMCSSGVVLAKFAVANTKVDLIGQLPPLTPQAALSAGGASGAIIKPLNTKTNILATWKDPESKFVRNAATFKTTVSKLPTYEPCPEHDNFSSKNINNTAPGGTTRTNQELINEWWNQSGIVGDAYWAWIASLGMPGPCPIPPGSKAPTLANYPGSITNGADAVARIAAMGYGCNAGQEKIQAGQIVAYNAAHPNAKLVTPLPGAPGNPQDGPADPIDVNSTTKDINMPALKCQLVTHEGRVAFVYVDSYGRSAGIGHFIPSSLWSQYPLKSAVTDSQIDAWYNADVGIALAGAQSIFSSTWADLSDIRKRALIDLTFNMGQSKLTTFVKFIAAMKAKAYDTAGRELRDSVWYSQVGKRGPNIIAMIVNNVDPNGCNDKFPPG